MSNLSNTERVDYTLFTCSNEGNVQFNIYSTVMVGKKGAEDRKLDPIYVRSYDSSKYSNKDSLDNVRIYTSNYVVFSYADWENKNTEEVFISYPNMSDLEDFLDSIMEEFVLNDKCFDKRHNVAPKYEDAQIVSEEFASGKIIKAIPCTIEKEDYRESGIALFINNDDYFIMMSISTFAGIYKMFSEFNLLQTSQLTLLIALSSGEDSGLSSGSKLKERPSNPLKKGKKSLLKRSKLNDEDEEVDDEDDDEEESKPTKKLKPRKKLAKVEEVDDEDDDEVFNNDSDDEDDDEEESKPTKKLKPKKKLSMSSIKKAVDEDDDEEDFD